MYLGIDFVKINDEETAKKFGIIHTPALIYFRKRTPMIYDGRSSSSFPPPLILDRFQLLLSLFGTAEPVAYSSFIFATIRASVLPLK